MTNAAVELQPMPAARVDCAHCGLPVSPSDTAREGPSFCCAGCRSVYAIVHAAGLTGYYQYRDCRRTGGLARRDTNLARPTCRPAGDFAR